ncbi:CYTH and CHAD domain-containing protein [soil metagenome]
MSATTEHHEVERAYAVGPDDVIPDLTALPDVASATEPVENLLVATYLDTADLALIRAGVTLRRRTGGEDAGWHLKIPAGDGRDEVRRPLGASHRVPAPLARAILGWTRGRAVGPVALVETRRTTRLLLDSNGEPLAEVADDVVLGTPEDASTTSAWREVEIELVGAGGGLLDAADELLAGFGIELRREQRKIGTVLATRLAKVAVAAPGGAGPTQPASRVLHHRLHDQVAELLRRDCDVRRGVDDGVHQLRVTCRRLRGALATYRPLVDMGVTESLRAELRWVARTLGDGRDAEVMHELLRSRVDAVPRRLVVGPVRRRLDRSYAQRLRAAGAHAEQVLTSRRYLRLLRRLELLVARPPWTALADEPAGEVIPRLVARDWRRLQRRVDLVLALDQGDEVARNEALHDVRKAAKRLRYACETLEPWWGEDAKALRKAAQEVTQVLGDRQDAAVAQRDLVRVAREARAAGESTFTFGLLHAREEATGVALEAAFVEVWERVRTPDLRGWLGEAAAPR